MYKVFMHTQINFIHTGIKFVYIRTYMNRIFHGPRNWKCEKFHFKKPRTAHDSTSACQGMSPPLSRAMAGWLLTQSTVQRGKIGCIDVLCLFENLPWCRFIIVPENNHNRNNCYKAALTSSHIIKIVSAARWTCISEYQPLDRFALWSPKVQNVSGAPLGYLTVCRIVVQQ